MPVPPTIKLLSYDANSDKWLEGCGCGGKQKIVHPLMPNTTPVFIQHNGFIVGPVTGIDYFIHPNTTTLNVDNADVAAWKETGFAKDPIPGFKGHEARVA